MLVLNDSPLAAVPLRGAPTTPAPVQGQEGRQRGDGNGETEQHTDPGDDPEFGEPAKPHQLDREEGRRGRHRGDGDTGAGSTKRIQDPRFQILRVGAFQFVFGNRVDPVGHADPDQRGDERRRDHVEVAELEQHRPERQADPDGQRTEHQERVRAPTEHEKRQQRDTDDGDRRRDPGVPPHRIHLLDDDCRLPGESDVKPRDEALNRSGPLAHGGDHLAPHVQFVAGVPGCDDQEVGAAVIGGEVAVGRQHRRAFAGKRQQRRDVFYGLGGPDGVCEERSLGLEKLRQPGERCDGLTLIDRGKRTAIAALLDLRGDQVVEHGQIRHLGQGLQQALLRADAGHDLAQGVGRQEVQPAFQEPIQIDAMEHVIDPFVRGEFPRETVDETLQVAGRWFRAVESLDAGDQRLGAGVFGQQLVHADLVGVVRRCQLAARGPKLDVKPRDQPRKQQQHRAERHATGVANHRGLESSQQVTEHRGTSSGTSHPVGHPC